MIPSFSAVPSPDDTTQDHYLVVLPGQLLCPDSGLWAPLNAAAFARLACIEQQRHLVASQAGIRYWVVMPAGEQAPEGYQWLGLRSQLGLIDEALFLLAGRALQLVQWHIDHQFCGRCGGPTSDASGERAKCCNACGQLYYPRLSPCMITLVTRGDECLLAHHVRASRPLYTALAGFVEVGERVEDTVHREVLEEVGLRVAAPRYFGSQPWPFPGQLMLGFHVEYLSGEICIDASELVDARWWHYSQLPEVPPATTLSGQLIAHFVAQRRAAAARSTR